MREGGNDALCFIMNWSDSIFLGIVYPLYHLSGRTPFPVSMADFKEKSICPVIVQTWTTSGV